MTCQEIADFLMDYVDGALSPHQRVIFEDHLGECPDCVAYLDSYRTTIAAAGQSREPAETAPEELIRAILAARKSDRTP